MNTPSKKTSLVALAITALALSRILFFLFNDPEGPNLLVVTVAAAIMYLLSLAAYRFGPSAKVAPFAAAILVQALSVIALYFCLS